MVVSGSKIYAVGGEGAFSAHDNIEVRMEGWKGLQNFLQL